MSLTLVIVDIDHFKIYNDDFGHLAGDDCLKSVAHALKAPLSRPADMIARFGGEEFVAILPETTIDGGKKMADAMRVQVESLAIPHANSRPRDIVTISVGVASTIPEKSLSPEALLMAADRALYDAKNSGRNSVSIRHDVVVKLVTR